MHSGQRLSWAVDHVPMCVHAQTFCPLFYVLWTCLCFCSFFHVFACVGVWCAKSNCTNHFEMILSPLGAKWDVWSEGCEQLKWKQIFVHRPFFPCCVKIIQNFPNEEPEMWKHRGGLSSVATLGIVWFYTELLPTKTQECYTLPRVYFKSNEVIWLPCLLSLPT